MARQGTNAHAIIGKLAKPADDTVWQGPATPWLRQQIWYEPSPHQLLMSAAVHHQPAGTAPLILSTSLARGALAFLRDHRVGGQILLPGAAMFEMGSAAASISTLVRRTPQVQDVVCQCCAVNHPNVLGPL